MAGVMNDLHAFRFNLDGTAGPFDFVCTRGWLVLDVIGATNVTVGAATATLQRSTAATPLVFSNACEVLAVDTISDIEYTGELVAAQRQYATGDTMRMVVDNAPQADVIVEVLPTTWIAG
ncbi:hypothetical protein CMI37_18895 [Candidatus Pacearchaeota archaeon]|nr:hypothetical protein [Candidatus Pacearchaeota archaeon]|tara:strand:+ start:272 stop:631 length:360 start_codon:yes stop_codon:yes gene_type:complete